VEAALIHKWPRSAAPQVCGQGDAIVLWEGRAAYLQIAALSRFQKLFKTTVKAKGEEQLYPEVFGRTNLGTTACNTSLSLLPCVIAL
jgi:hypothetical protein